MARLDPNEGIAPENFPRLNSEFYAAKPWVYFRERLRTVAVVASAPDELDALTRSGLEVGTFRIAQEDPQAGPPVLTEEEKREDEEERQAFVAAESEVLLHHVAETLLRLYLAHEARSSCPWLDMASVRSFGEFKEAVATLRRELVGEARRDAMAAVFFGASDRADLTPSPSDEEWEQSRTNVAGWLRFFAAHFLDAALYNAAKHGFAIQPGAAQLSIAVSGEEEPFLTGSGPCISYLEAVVDRDGDRKWSRTTRWVTPSRNLTYVFMGTRMIHALWNVARWRYLDDSLRVDFLREMSVLEAHRASPSHPLSKTSWRLAYLD